MTDAIFQPNLPPAPEAPPSRRQAPKKAKNKGGRPRKEITDVTVTTGGPGTKTTVFATSRRKARTVKIDLSLAMSALAGLTEDDVKFLTGVIGAMQPFSSAQRRRIAGAISKVFA